MRNAFVAEVRAAPTRAPGRRRRRRGPRRPPLRCAQYHGVWHCFVGRNFGSYGTYEQGHYVYFYMGQHAVMLFKTN